MTTRSLKRLFEKPTSRLCALTLGLLLACSPTLRAPSTPPGRTIELGQERGGKKSPKEFAVVFAGPTGEVDGEPEISVVMNRSLRPLGVAGEGPLPPITITPKLNGKTRWVGQSSFVFTPEGGRLPLSTAFTVTVPKGTKAMSGESLASDYTFSFSTARPKIVQTSPSDGATGLRENTKFELFLNQPIAPTTIEKYVSLNVKAGEAKKALGFRVTTPDPKSPKHLLLEPKAPLPKNSTIAIDVSAALPGSEGPLTASEPVSFGYETYGPLRVSELRCPEGEKSNTCYANGNVWLELSNPVPFGELKKFVSVEPKVPLNWGTYRTDEEETLYSDVPFPLLAGKTYKVTIKAGLRDVFGQRLEKDRTATFVVDDYVPNVAVGVRGEYFEASRTNELPIASVNVDEYRVTTSALTPERIVEAYGHDRTYEEENRLLLAKGSTLVRRPNGVKNVPSGDLIPFGELAKKPGFRGPLAIGVDYRARGEAVRSTTIVQVTDLAVSAKLSREKTGVVMVTDLGKGTPIEGAEVWITGPEAKCGKKKSDKEGMVTVEPGCLGDVSETNKLFLFAKKGSDFTFRRVNAYLQSWRLGVPAEPLGKPEKHGLLFSERGLYRPGDTVLLKGLVRHEGDQGSVISTDEALSIRIMGPSYDEIETKDVTTGAFGSFNTSFRVPPSAQLGSYRAELSAADGTITYAYFEVLEYRPTEIQVGAESNQPSYFQAQKAEYLVSGDYLYGAKMIGAKVSYRTTRLETYHSIPGFEGFVTSADLFDSAHPERAPAGGFLGSGEGTLDKNGEFRVTVPLDLPGQRGPELVSLDAEITDVTNQASTTSTSALVHPSSYYVGLRPLDPYFVGVGAKVTPEALVLTPSGVVTRGRDVKLDLYERRWEVSRETSAEYYSDVHVVDTLVQSCTFRSADKASGCALEAKKAGYYVVVASTKDEKGRKTSAATDLYALGSGESHWPDRDDFKVELTADKKQYKVGDVAKILVKSPFKRTRALVTIESDGVKESRVRILEGATPTLEFPVTEAMRPNAYVGVHLLKERTSPVGKTKDDAAEDLHAPSFRVGYAEIRVNPEARRLKVQLTPNKADFLPGAPIDVKLLVKNGEGKPESAEVTVYAVDEGVLSLIGYRTPDPLVAFTAPRPLRTVTLEDRESLGRIQKNFGELLGLGADKGAAGGGGGEASGGARRDFRQSAYFNPAVLTNEKGEASISFKLPESLTTYRLMAVATTKNDRYGYTETRVTTSRRLMARPALPRILRAGDTFDAKLAISAKNFGPTETIVRLDVQGAVALGSLETSVLVAKNGQGEARFPLRVDSPGDVNLAFHVRAKDGSAEDKVLIKRAALLPLALEATALYGETEGTSAEALGLLEKARSDAGGLSVSLSTTALVGLGSGFGELLEYPYGCSEQISSRLLPLLGLEELAKDLSIPLPKDPKTFVEKGLAELLSRQRGDGGFGMWPNSTESSRWVSPYVLWTLSEAKKRGYSVPENVIARGRDYLRHLLDAQEVHFDPVVGTFALDVLAMLGTPDVGYENRLLEASKRLPVFAKALLLHALAVGKSSEERSKGLLREIENGLVLTETRVTFVGNHGDDYAVYLDSDVRTTALVLRALVAVDPKHPLLGKLARGLVMDRKGGTFRSTQEASMTLVALADYRRQVEGGKTNFGFKIWGDDSILTQGRFDAAKTSSQTFSFPMKDLRFGKLAFEKAGTGRLFYEARLAYARKELPKDSLDEGFTVEKRMKVLSAAEQGGPIPMLETDQGKFSARDLVVVDLLVATPEPRHFAVIDDPLPAGFEAVDSSLANSRGYGNLESTSGMNPDYDDVAHDRAVLSGYTRRELRDDRVVYFLDWMRPGIYHFRYLARATTTGTFVAGPTKAEEMYAPEVFGRTAARVTEIH